MRNFPAARQAILDDMIRLRTQLRPDLVLTPCSDDMHQDHHTVYQESVRAFKHGSMLGYEMPWNTLVAATQMFVALERTHMERKLAALAEYKSQGTRPYAAPEFIRAWASTRGLSIGVPLAEAFQVIRWVWPGNAIEKPAAP